MHIVIDISEEMYDWLDTGFPDEDDAEKLWQIVKKGAPLPKGHGTLIERNKVFNALHTFSVNKALKTICDIPVIIEADKEVD